MWISCRKAAWAVDCSRNAALRFCFYSIYSSFFTYIALVDPPCWNSIPFSNSINTSNYQSSKTFPLYNYKDLRLVFHQVFHPVYNINPISPTHNNNGISVVLLRLQLRPSQLVSLRRLHPVWKSSLRSMRWREGLRQYEHSLALPLALPRQQSDLRVPNCCLIALASHPNLEDHSHAHSCTRASRSTTSTTGQLHGHLVSLTTWNEAEQSDLHVYLLRMRRRP